MRSITLIALGLVPFGIAALGLVAPAPLAADSKGRFAPKGAGLIRCEQFVAEHAAGSDAYLLFRGWIDGYLTAVNQYEPGNFDVTAWQTPASIATLIDNHCGKHPDDEVLAVAMTIVSSLRSDRIRSESTLVKLENNEGKHVLLYEETLRRLQSKLADSGFYDGEPSGAFNTGTETAIRTFQSSNGLEETGLPDQNTLWRLLKPLAPG